MALGGCIRGSPSLCASCPPRCCFAENRWTVQQRPLLDAKLQSSGQCPFPDWPLTGVEPGAPRENDQSATLSTWLFYLMFKTSTRAASRYSNGVGLLYCTPLAWYNLAGKPSTYYYESLPSCGSTTITVLIIDFRLHSWVTDHLADSGNGSACPTCCVSVCLCVTSDRNKWKCRKWNFRTNE